MTTQIDGNQIFALSRLLEAYEAGAEAAVASTNHLLGAVKHEEYASRDADGNVTISPHLLARLFRAFRGERVEAGRLVLNRQAPSTDAVRQMIRSMEGAGR